MATTVDAQMAFKDLPDEENVFSLFSGVINHMIYTQMLRDISERFNKSKNENTLLMEEKILKGIFIKNTMILDGFRDLAQKDFEMHPAMWRAAFESLTYGDVPFFQNFKLSHVAGIDKFYAQVYRNLKIMEDEFTDYSDEYKEKALQQWRGVFSNLVSDRVLFADIAAIEEISNVFSLLKTKARIFSNYEEDVLSSSLNTMYSVMKTDAKRFLLTYGFNVNKIDSYMPSVNEDISNVLLHELIPLEQKNIIMKKSAQIDIKEIYNELGFENEPVYRLFYAQAFKTTMSVFYPEIEFAVKDFVLDKKLLNEIEEFKHAGMDRLENLMKLASNNSDLNVIFIANEDVMNETYPIHVLSVIGTLVNASIINNLNKKCIPEIKPFDSIDNRLITRSNGDIFNDALFAMRETIEFFENKDYIKHKEIINKIKLSVREHNLKYQLSLDGNEKKDVKIRMKV